jgi:hypothetical protein
MADPLRPDNPDQPTLTPRLSREQIAERNKPYVDPNNKSPWNTQLNPMDEVRFRGWLAQHKVPFNPDVSVSDYDMRGFYRGLLNGDPRARTGVDPNDQRLHYTDYYKTPLHETFSRESQWAKPDAPQWNEQDQLVAPSGRIQFDDKAK